jgi:hypothetical protein
MTYEQMVEGPTPKTFINEPIIEAESATARALRLWFNRSSARRGEPIKQEFNERAS